MTHCLMKVPVTLIEVGTSLVRTFLIPLCCFVLINGASNYKRTNQNNKKIYSIQLAPIKYKLDKKLKISIHSMAILDLVVAGVLLFHYIL